MQDTSRTGKNDAEDGAERSVDGGMLEYSQARKREASHVKYQDKSVKARTERINSGGIGESACAHSAVPLNANAYEAVNTGSEPDLTAYYLDFVDG